MASNLYFDEIIPDTLTMRYPIEEKLFSEQSEFQKVDVVTSKAYGKMLFLDDLVMISERDEHVYHEMISHVPLFTLPKAERVLIIGGGDGGTAREVLRHASVKRCVNVEIDGMVVDVCRKYLPQTACGFDDPRMELIIGDGVKYMEETSERFDLILVDSTDPIGAAAPLFGTAFYNNVYRVLSEDGMVVSQGESANYFAEGQLSVAKSMLAVFPIFRIYNYNNLSYPGAPWSFAVGSKKYCPLADFQRERAENAGLAFKYYNADLHRAAFALPNFQRELLKSAGVSEFPKL